MLTLSLIFIALIVKVISKMLIDLDDAHYLVKEKIKDIHDEKERYKNFVEDLGDRYFAYRHNLRGDIEYLSDNAQNILGVKNQDLLSNNFKESIHWSKESLENSVPMIRRLIRKKHFI